MGKWICFECQGAMKKADEFVLVCDDCGHSVDIVDYGHEEETHNSLFGYKPYKDDVPEGCSACGGPYPSCKTSCALFN